MRVFISYASKDEAQADELSLALKAQGHEVFFDSDRIKGGQNYNPIIHTAIQNSDLMVFLISPESIKKGSYARTELRFAREKWDHPNGRVLPVVSRQVNRRAIPAYLKAVSILEPEGNLVPEVLAAVAAWSTSEGSTRQDVAVPPVHAAMLLGYELSSIFSNGWSSVIMRHYPIQGVSDVDGAWWSDVFRKLDGFAAALDVEISTLRDEPEPIPARGPDEPMRFREIVVEREYKSYFDAAHRLMVEIERQLSGKQRRLEVAHRLGFGLGRLRLLFPMLMEGELGMVPDKARMGLITYAKKLAYGRKTYAEARAVLRFVNPDARSLGVDQRLIDPFSKALNDEWKKARNVYCSYSWSLHPPAMVELFRVKLETEFSLRRSLDALVIDLPTDSSVA